MWSILNEIKARDLKELAVTNMVTILNDEGRADLFQNLDGRQPRRFPKSGDGIVTPEMLEEMKKFERDFERAGRTENG